MDIKKIISSVTIGAGAIVIGLGLQYALADWSSAPPNPPTCPSSISGCNAPINVGAAGQAKNGGLTLGSATPLTTSSSSLDVENGSFIKGILTQGFALVNGSQGNGKVLQSDANGLATWVATSSLNIGGKVTQIKAGTGISISYTGATSGTGVVTITCSGCSSGGGSGTTIEGSYTIEPSYDSGHYEGQICSSSGNVVKSGTSSCSCPDGDTTINLSGSVDAYGHPTDSYECQTP
jgi:hypothetical protein